jgi:hypothetical protein
MYRKMANHNIDALNDEQKKVYKAGVDLKKDFETNLKPKNTLTENLTQKINKTNYTASSILHLFDCGLLKFLLKQSLNQDKDLEKALACTSNNLEIYVGVVATANKKEKSDEDKNKNQDTANGTTTAKNNNDNNEKKIGGNGENMTNINPIYVKVADNSFTQVGQIFKNSDDMLCFVFSSTEKPCFEFIVKKEYAVANYRITDETNNTKMVCLKLDNTKNAYTADKKVFYTLNGDTIIFGSFNANTEVNITTLVKCEKNICTPADTSTLFTLFGYNVSKTSAALATAAVLGSAYLYRKMKKKSKRKSDSASSSRSISASPKYKKRKSSKRGK